MKSTSLVGFPLLLLLSVGCNRTPANPAPGVVAKDINGAPVAIHEMWITERGDYHRYSVSETAFSRGLTVLVDGQPRLWCGNALWRGPVTVELSIVPMDSASVGDATSVKVILKSSQGGSSSSCETTVRLQKGSSFAPYACQYVFPYKYSDTLTVCGYELTASRGPYATNNKPDHTITLVLGSKTGKLAKAH